MKHSVIFATMCSFLLVFDLGCGPKSEHNANWYYYWEKDNVIEGLDRAGSPFSRWDWSVEAKNKDCYGAAHGPSNGYVLTDLCITSPRESPFKVIHKTSGRIRYIGERTVFGMEHAATTMTHEKQHILNYQKCMQFGQTDSDHDQLADSEENCDPYQLVIGLRDTYDLKSAFDNYEPYGNYGDDEFISRIAGALGVNKAKLDQDWSKGGAQWGR